MGAAAMRLMMLKNSLKAKNKNHVIKVKR